MNIPIRPGGPSIAAFQSSGAAPSSGKSGFASFMAGIAPVANAAAGVGKAVLGTVLGPAGGIVGSLAQGLVGAATEHAKYLDMVDKVRVFAMNNAIFDAGNMPVVERDNS